MSKSSALLILCAAALLTAPVSRAEPAVLGLARAYRGPQSTLDAIASVHYVGTLERPETDPKAKAEVVTTLDMIFAKPLRQKLVVRGPKFNVTTVLDGYDGWDRFEDNADPTKFKLKWLQAADIKTLRANTWENLYCYQAPDNGSLEDKGPATIDGVVCERVDFTHGEGIVYERYFDRDTGRLVMTVRGAESIRETGQIMVDGVRFPKAIVSTTKTADGKELVATATFDRILINERLSPDMFAAPSATADGTGPAAVRAPGK